MDVDERGDRYYNGLPSQLMNELYDAIKERTPIEDYEDWDILSLYIARACYVLQQRGWQKQHDV